MEFEYSFGTELFKECIKNSVGAYIKYESGNHYSLKYKELEKVKKFSNIQICFDGGLVIGNLHTNGGIQLFKPCQTIKDTIVHVGEIEGGEYVTSMHTTKENLFEFQCINNDINIKSHFDHINFKIPTNCKTINLKGKKHQIIILSDNLQFVINRAATKKHIHRIIELDSE